MSDFSVWYRSIPFFTRYWLTLTLAFTLSVRFGILRGVHLILSYDHIIREFQIWRPFTALFFYPLNPSSGFHFLINCYFLYSYSIRLETGQFFGRPADYCFLLIFNWLVCVAIGFFVQLSVLMDPMVLSVLYIWCQLNRNIVVSFWFGSRFKALYLPWVLFAFNSIVMGSGLMELCGIIVGHIYYFLIFKYPQEFGGASIISTPSILYKYFPSTTTNNQQFGRPPSGKLNYLGYFLSNLENFILLTFVVFIGFILAMMFIKENWQEERQVSQTHTTTGCVCHWATCGPELICTKIICFFGRIFKKISPKSETK